MILHRTAFALALLLGLGSSGQAQFLVGKVNGGRVVLKLDASVLASSGLQLTELLTTAEVGDPIEEKMEGPFVGFAIDSSSTLLYLAGRDGNFVPYGVLGGTVQAIGGFTLVSPSTGKSADLHDFAFRTLDVRNDGPGGEPDPDYFTMGAAGPGRNDDFRLCYVKIIHDADGVPYGDPDHVQPILTIKAFDLFVTPTLAAKLGRPELVDVLLGTGKIEATVETWDGPWSYPPGQNPWTPYTGGPGPGAGGADAVGVDVKLGILSSITALGHVGTFPNGRVGLATATTSCNVGTLNVPWLAQMQENHPGISQTLYRELGDRFEQVGAAWIKHGFFALSSSQCTPCQNPSPGTFLGVGCSDTYGVSNNGDRNYLGPRHEWNAYTAKWTCLGSYFDGVPVDCNQSVGGGGFNSVDHRLEAFDYDLNNPGATYYYEGYYLVRDDVDLHNNIGSRRCTMTWNGSAWSFSTPSSGSGNPLVEGPAIERWGDFRATAGLGPHDGNVILAVKTRDLGGGQWRYEYALFNWNLHRKVRGFSVPAAGQASSPYFHDIDDQAANNWVTSVAGGNVHWDYNDVVVSGHKVGGALPWGTLYNFGFTSNRPPVARNATLTIHQPGPGGDLLAVPTLAPSAVNLTASVLAPAVGQQTNLVVSGGTSLGIIALLEVSGIPLADALLIGPVPYDGNGQAILPVTIPPEAAGLDLLLIGADVTINPLALVEFSNTIEVQVQ